MGGTLDFSVIFQSRPRAETVRSTTRHSLPPFSLSIPGEMKVYVHYEEGSDAELHVTLKLTLPKKWNDESPMKLLTASTSTTRYHRVHQQR